MSAKATASTLAAWEILQRSPQERCNEAILTANTADRTAAVLTKIYFIATVLRKSWPEPTLVRITPGLDLREY
jgi:hypothetical protein